MICGLVVLIISPALPAFILRLGGFQPQGTTDAIFRDSISDAPSLQNPVNLSALTLSVGEYKWTIPSPALSGDINGQSAIQITLDEAQLTDFCNQISDICGEFGYPIRQAHFDLRNGGGILYGDVFISQLGIWQSLGFVWRINTDNRIELLGIDMGSALYALPSGLLSQQVLEAEAFANRLLETIWAQTSNAQYRLSHLNVTDDSLVATFR